MKAADAIAKMKANRAAMEAKVMEERAVSMSSRGMLLRSWLAFQTEMPGATKEQFLAWAKEQVP